MNQGWMRRVSDFPVVVSALKFSQCWLGDRRGIKPLKTSDPIISTDYLPDQPKAKPTNTTARNAHMCADICVNNCYKQNSMEQFGQSFL